MTAKIKKIRSLKDLNTIKERVSKKLECHDGIRIVVGLGTCGVAAGARIVYDTIVKEVNEIKLDERISVEETGCVGICQFEPVVEVYEPDGKRTTYVHMTKERAELVVRQHIRGGNPIADFTIGAARIGR